MSPINDFMNNTHGVPSRRRCKHALICTALGLAITGCGEPTTSLLLVNESNFDGVQFDITRVEVWTRDGCTGENILDAPISPGGYAEIEGIPVPPSEFLDFCVFTTAGDSDPSEIEGSGWEYAPGCEFDMTMNWESYTQSVSYVKGRSCPDNDAPRR